MGTRRIKPRKTGTRIPFRGRLHKSKNAILGTCASCHFPAFTNGTMNYVEDVRTGRAWAWHPWCEKPQEVLDLEAKYPPDQRQIVTPDREEAAFKQAQVEMMNEIRRQFPDRSPEEHHRLLDQATVELRAAWAAEKAGKTFDPRCRCTHLHSEHVGGVGRCKYVDCDCEGFQERLQ